MQRKWLSQAVIWVCWVTVLATDTQASSTKKHFLGKEKVAVAFTTDDFTVKSGTPRKFPASVTASFLLDGKQVTFDLSRNHRVHMVPAYWITEQGRVERVASSDASGVNLHLQSHYQCPPHSGSFMLKYDEQRDAYFLDGVFSYDRADYYITHKPDVHDSVQFDLPPPLKSDDIYSHHVIFKMAANRKTNFEQESAPHTNQQTREKRQAQVYEIETLAVLDYSVFAFWYARSEATSDMDRTTAALTNLRQYYAFLMDAVDLRFRSIQHSDMTFRVLYKGLVISNSPSESTWTESNKISSGSSGFTVNATAALKSFSDWQRLTTGLPARDHSIMFTAYSFSREDFAGLAYISSICTDTSASVAENGFDFLGVLTAAHEIGHSLGAVHDVSSSQCPPDDRYIMSSSADLIVTPGTAGNPWKFSTCSINAFRQRIAQMDSAGTNCLTSQGSGTTLRPPEIRPGQSYDVDTVCHLSIGKGSVFCRSAYNTSSLPTICTALLCVDETGCQAVAPLQGIPCGNKKWCDRGFCVSSADAPAVNELCPFGDSPGSLLNGQTCADLIVEPLNCYSDSFRRVCCASCAAKERSNISCLYGDMHRDCATISLWNCYTADTERFCCQTCPQWRNHSATGCEYGDRSPACPGIEDYLCYSNEELCCKTCPERKRDTDCPYGDKDVISCPGIERHRCYLSPNNDTCCDTCGSLKTGPEGCEWGDRDPTCASLPFYVCYDEFYQNLCCEKCHWEPWDDCPFGDKSRECSTIESWMCYNNNDTCCKTCENQKTGLVDCDYGDRAPPNNCSNLQENVHYCYDHDVNWSCCSTCLSLENPLPGCQFGDRTPDQCKTILPASCYTNESYSACCKTCDSLANYSRPGCEFGDKAVGCTLSQCEDQALATGFCCGTCWDYTTVPSTTTWKPTAATQSTTKTGQPKQTATLQKSTIKITPKPTKQTKQTTPKPKSTTHKATTHKTPKPTTPLAPKPTTQITLKPTTPLAPKPTTQTTMKPTTPLAPKPTKQTTLKIITPLAPKPTTQTTRKPTTQLAPKPTTLRAIRPIVSSATPRPSLETKTTNLAKTAQIPILTKSTTTSDGTRANPDFNQGFKTEHAIGVGVGAVVLIGIIALVTCCLCRRKKVLKERNRKESNNPKIKIHGLSVDTYAALGLEGRLHITPQPSPQIRPKATRLTGSPRHSPDFSYRNLDSKLQALPRTGKASDESFSANGTPAVKHQDLELKLNGLGYNGNITHGDSPKTRPKLSHKVDSLHDSPSMKRHDLKHKLHALGYNGNISPGDSPKPRPKVSQEGGSPRGSPSIKRHDLEHKLNALGYNGNAHKAKTHANYPNGHQSSSSRFLQVPHHH